MRVDLLVGEQDWVCDIDPGFFASLTSHRLLGRLTWLDVTARDRPLTSRVQCEDDVLAIEGKAVSGGNVWHRRRPVIQPRYDVKRLAPELLMDIPQDSRIVHWPIMLRPLM